MLIARIEISTDTKGSVATDDDWCSSSFSLIGWACPRMAVEPPPGWWGVLAFLIAAVNLTLESLCTVRIGANFGDLVRNSCEGLGLGLGLRGRVRG
jgi:hypothetical protein